MLFRIMLFVGFLSSVIAPPLFAEQETKLKGYHIEIILDVSGSMSDMVENRQKIDIAKQAIEKMLGEIPKSANLAFRAYGHRDLPEGKQCTDSQLLIPFGGASRQKIIETISPLKPRGLTPIDYSLRQAYADFPNATEFGKMIVLVSDGQETCGGNPCAAVRELRAKGAEVQVNVIGFDVDQLAAKQLRCIADATGGEYRTANNAKDLVDGLKAMAQRAKITYETTAAEIKPGSGWDDATPLESGEFKYEILGDERHFYKMDIAKGQKLIAVLRARAKEPRRCQLSANVAISIYDKYKRPIDSSYSNVSAASTGFRTATFEQGFGKTMTVFAVVSRGPTKAATTTDKGNWDKEFVSYELGLYLEGPQE